MPPPTHRCRSFGDDGARSVSEAQFQRGFVIASHAMRDGQAHSRPVSECLVGDWQRGGRSMLAAANRATLEFCPGIKFRTGL
jgi:hypothetical protein